MLDTFLYLVCMATIGMCHCQWFCENPPVTFGVVTEEVAGFKYQGRTTVKKLYILYLTETTAVYPRGTHAATWAYGTPSYGMRM